jgi:hypothetical protein
VNRLPQAARDIGRLNWAAGSAAGAAARAART